MAQYLQAVQQAMVSRGWRLVSAHAEIQYDPAHLLEPRDDGMTADYVAIEVIRQTNIRKSAIQ
jgi:hypothetical protein